MDALQGRMGYDRAITVFSPDGRILQVEYARKTVSQGTPALGIVYKDGVALLAVKKVIDKLTVIDSIEKVSIIDDHIGVTSAGLIGDGRVLIEKAQQIAQKHKITYDDDIDVITLTRKICDHKQAYTQWGGSRPFGISLLIAGIDDYPHLLVTEPSGIYFEYKATAIGEKSNEIIKELEKDYKENMTQEQAVKLGLTILKRNVKDVDIKTVDIGIINASDRKFRTLTKEEIKKLWQ